MVEAQRTGKGRYIDVAMTDSVLAHTYFTMLRLNDSGHSVPRGSDLLAGGLPCYGAYRCADGRHMAVGALEGKFWKLCCEVLGCPEWVGRQWDASLRAELATLFATRPRDDWAKLFAAVDCCVTPILTPEEALENEQIVARGMVLEEDGLTQFAPPLKMSEFEFSIRQSAPAAGQHTASILTAAGYGSAEIEHLTAKGVLG